MPRFFDHAEGARRLGGDWSWRRAAFIRYAGVVLLALIAASSLLQLKSVLGVPGTPYALVAGGAMAAVCLLGAWRLGGPWLPLVVAASLRLAVIATVHPALVSDWAKYESIAESIARGGQLFADVPTGLPLILGSLYAVFGVHPVFSEFLNLGAALGTTYLVYRMAGSVPAMLFAIIPGQILMTALLSTEVSYAFALTLVVWLVAERRAWLLSGMAVGLSQYLRSSAELVAVAVAFAAVRRPRELGLFVCAMALVLLPIFAWNLANGSLSVSTSRYIGWQVLIGTNQKYDGRFNDEDVLLQGPNDLAIGIGRITGDPLGFAGLVVRKFRWTWGDETYAPFWTVGGDSPSYSVWAVLSQLGLVLLTIPAFISVLRRPPSRAGLVSLAILLAFAAAYVFTESQGRYHFYFIPLLAILVAVPPSPGNRATTRSRVPVSAS